MKYETNLPFTITVNDNNEKYCDIECDGIRDYEYCAYFDSELYFDEVQMDKNDDDEYLMKRCKECVIATNNIKKEQNHEKL